MEQYNSIQQLLKKEGGKKNPVFPPTVVQAVFDAKTGASLEAILAQFNSVYLPYQGTPQATRLIIPKEMRRAGLTITYMNMDSETITERANSAVQKDNDHWGLDVNWSRVDELTLSGDISVSAQGTWIINGSDTGVKAVGPKGDAGITPWLKTIDNRIHVSYDNVNWEPCSEPISAYFRWSSNKIQISRDNKTWTDLSGTFADNVHIKGYVATTSALPSGAAQGDIYGVGPTYAAEDTAHTNPIYRLYVRNANTWVDNGSFTSIAAGIVQEHGDRENAVMSQKAVTEKLSELGSEMSLISISSTMDNYISNLSIATKNGASEGKLILADGTEGVYTDYGISPYILINKEKSYYYLSCALSARFCAIVMYDENKSIIGKVLGNYVTENKWYKLSLTTATYIRVCYNLYQPNNYLYEGAVVNGFEDIKSIVPSRSVNRFNYLSAKIGFINSSGAINVSSSDFFYSDYIQVQKGEVIRIYPIQTGGGIRVEQYDNSFKPIEGTNEGANIGLYTMAENAAYFRFSGLVQDIQKTMCVSGAIPSVYVPFDTNSGNTLYDLSNEMPFLPCGDVLAENLVEIPTSYEDGIFGAHKGGSWVTSDYVEIKLTDSPYYLYLKHQYKNTLTQVEFYDKDKNVLKTIKGGQWAFSYAEKIVKLNPPKGSQYIRFSKYTDDEGYGLFEFNGTNLKHQVNQAVNIAYTENRNIMWIGTSIPAGGTYPRMASEACGYNCLNKAVGSSHLCFRQVHPDAIQSYSGYELTATVAELESMYRADVDNGVISEEWLNNWKSYSYENSIIPYIDGTNDIQISMLVIDHGVNDHAAIHEQMQNKDLIDWESRDRKTFVGAFNYLMDKIHAINPFLKIVISGHYDNTFERWYSADVCEMQRLVAEHHSIYIMKAWEHTQINNRIMKGTSMYLSKYNAKFGTSWTAEKKDNEGNIMALQVYMPDVLHPHSDLTGNCNKRLNAVYTKLLRDCI